MVILVSIDSPSCNVIGAVIHGLEYGLSTKWTIGQGKGQKGTEHSSLTAHPTSGPAQRDTDETDRHQCRGRLVCPGDAILFNRIDIGDLRPFWEKWLTGPGAKFKRGPENPLLCEERY